MDDLVTALEAQRTLRVNLEARAATLTVGIDEVAAILGEVEGRLRDAESDVARSIRETGGTFSEDGLPITQTVWIDGERLSGPDAPDSPRARARAAFKVLRLLQAEAVPVRAGLLRLRSQRADVVRAIGATDDALRDLDRQLAGARAAEADRERLLGPTDWRERLAGALSASGSGG